MVICNKRFCFIFCTSLFPKKLSENVLFVALVLIQRQYRQNESGSEQIAYIIQERSALEEHSDCAENESGDCKKSVLDQHPEDSDNSPDDAADESAPKGKRRLQGT